MRIGNVAYISPSIKGLDENGRPFGIVNVKEFGAKGDGVTDDTAAIQAALDTKRRVYLPKGTYKISQALRIHEYGQCIEGEDPWLTIIRQTGANQHGIIVDKADAPHPTQGGPHAMSNTIRNLRIEGPGAGVSIASGIFTDDPTDSHVGDWLEIDNVTVYGFDAGIRLSDMGQVRLNRIFSHYNNYGIIIEGGSANSYSASALITGRNTNIGVWIKSGSGGVLQLGDQGSQPIHVRVESGASVVILGSNMESASIAAVYVKTNAAATVIGARVLEGGSASYVPFQVEGSGKLTLVSCSYAGFATGVPMAKKLASSAMLTILGEVTVAGDLGAGNPSSVSVEDSGELFRATPYPSRIDNAVPSANAALRGMTLFVPARASVQQEDRLIQYIRLRDGTFEGYDLVNTRHVYSTSGSNHGRVQQMREATGRKNFTTAAGAYTTVTVNIGAFVALYSATATVFRNSGNGPAYVEVSSFNGSTGDVTFTVHHPNDTAGGLSLVLHYSIAASY